MRDGEREVLRLNSMYLKLGNRQTEDRVILCELFLSVDSARAILSISTAPHTILALLEALSIHVL